MESRTNSDALYRALLQQIIDLTLYPGMGISENAISKQFAVSRSVVRGAFARLVQLKFLVVYPQRGTYVSLINPNYIRKALFIRAAVEKEVLRGFMKRQMDKTEIFKKMEANLKDQHLFTDEKKYVERFRLLDEEFHNYILAANDSEDVLSLLDDHLLHIARWRNIYVDSGVSLSMLVDQHARILGAIEANDLKDALDATDVHINTVHEMVLSDPKFSDYFEKEPAFREAKDC
ncbi:MAG: GntR family transcriptional regulator [Peptoniphilus sp.]|nr:GntR family transcriptional regulator [Peptoniphilus sp.]MDY3118077.1 GntR family transcriptional regulator [Peptoniphilus sp.]